MNCEICSSPMHTASICPSRNQPPHVAAVGVEEAVAVFDPEQNLKETRGRARKGKRRK